jgi:hypothetical protein
MMDQFKVCYIPGGMSLNHSAWWVCVTVFQDGVSVRIPVKRLTRSTYQ